VLDKPTTNPGRQSEFDLGYVFANLFYVGIQNTTTTVALGKWTDSDRLNATTPTPIARTTGRCAVRRNLLSFA